MLLSIPSTIIWLWTFKFLNLYSFHSSIHSLFFYHSSSIQSPKNINRKLTVIIILSSQTVSKQPFAISKFDLTCSHQIKSVFWVSIAFKQESETIILTVEKVTHGENLCKEEEGEIAASSVWAEKNTLSWDWTDRTGLPCSNRTSQMREKASGNREIQERDCMFFHVEATLSDQRWKNYTKLVADMCGYQWPKCFMCILLNLSQHLPFVLPWGP